MKRLVAAATTIIAILAFAAPVWAQDIDESGRPVRDNFETVTGATEVPQGSVCTIEDVNNQSTYSEGVTIPNSDGQIDRGNVLRVMLGRGGEHDGDWASFPVERVEGIETIGSFTTTGDGFGGPGNIMVWVGYDWHTSLDGLTLDCVPPTPPTTTTVAPTTTTAAPTTTQVDAPTTTNSSTTTETTTSVPMLAVTGPGTTGLLAAIGAMFLLAGIAAKRMAGTNEQSRCLCCDELHNGEW